LIKNDEGVTWFEIQGLLRKRFLSFWIFECFLF